MNNNFQKIKQAIEALRLGKMIILVDDEGRENEGDLVIAAEKITPEAINFMSRYARGLICMTMMPEDFERLEIPLMISHNRNKYATAFGVSIGAASGVSTGISAADRARTIQVAADPKSTATDLAMPGHVFPLRAQSGGVLVRQGHTEGSVDLVRLAGLKPAAAICEVMNEDGSMARRADLEKFAKEHDLLIVDIAELLQYRLAQEGPVDEKLPIKNNLKEMASAKLLLAIPGDFTIKIFEDEREGSQAIAVLAGEIQPQAETWVRIHSECFTGDVLGSTRCDCGAQLESALACLAEHGGVLLYLRQEGRGIGLANKIKAYALQEQGLDTVEANHHLGFEADHREYAMAAEILRKLGVQRVRLLTNNPLKVSGLEACGISVSGREALEISPLEHNFEYLKTKRDKLGHLLQLIKKERHHD